MNEELDPDSTETVELLGRAQSGDPVAQSHLFLGLRRHLLGRIRAHPLSGMLAKWEGEEEVLSVVWDTVFRRRMLDRFKPRGEGSLRAYLGSAVDGVVKDMLDRATAQKRGGGEKPHRLTSVDSSTASRNDPKAPGVGPTTEVRGEELLNRSEALLGGLQRDVWKLRVREELEFTEIAHELGITAGAARGHFRRARERIRESGLTQ